MALRKVSITMLTSAKMQDIMAGIELITEQSESIDVQVGSVKDKLLPVGQGVSLISTSHPTRASGNGKHKRRRVRRTQGGYGHSVRDRLAAQNAAIKAKDPRAVFTMFRRADGFEWEGLDVDATLKNIGITRAELISGRHKQGSLEFRVKSAINMRARRGVQHSTRVRKTSAPDVTAH